MQKEKKTESWIRDLVKQMTPEEKVGQMRLCSDLKGLLSEIRQGNAKPGAYGFAFMPDGLRPEEINEIQAFYRENGHRIPLLIAGEGIHGVMHPSATVFPQCLAMASSFHVRLVEQVAETIGKEAHAVGLDQVYAPNLDLARDPRWGRVQENYGEDPYLTACMGEAYVRAVQKAGVAATLKHFVAHGSPESGINLAPVHMGEREMREVTLEPFRTAVRAGAMSVMPAYSELDGEPLHASKRYLRKLLREELGFDGVTVSDYGGVEMLHSFHRTAENSLDAGRQALAAGLDVEAPTPYGYGEDFVRALREGKVEEEAVDEAVCRILRLKERLHLLEGRTVSNADVVRQCHTENAVSLAKTCAAESAVLLKNNGILPLSKTIGTVAVVGCHADNVVAGDYTYFPLQEERNVSLYRGLCEKLGKDRVRYAKGCEIASGTESQLREAVAAAQASDAVVVALGDNSNFFGGIGWGDRDGKTLVNCGEGFDVHDLDLPLAQKQLLRELAKTKKPLILILFTGRPQTIAEEVALSDAVFQAWYLGEQGGNALADLLFGDEVPSGKLPVSFPRSTGSLPCFYNHKPSAKGYYHRSGSPEIPGRDYVFDSPQALFPFGYGLSYTEFRYSGLSVEVREDQTVSVCVQVENIGHVDAMESVLLFLACEYCRITPFVRRLRRFEKIRIPAGQVRSVQFVLRPEDFTFIDENYRESIAYGSYRVTVGTEEQKFLYQSEPKKN